MSTEIERLRFYEREYLRSFDFEAEQRYHLEMRRRLNLALHLWGIVEGLELIHDTALVPDAPAQAYITAGIAIDAYGREIIVPVNHPLADELDKNRINGAGTYLVWLAYKRAPATPPEGGYRLCDLNDQYTRWRESYEIILTTVTNPNPATEPQAFGSLSDDSAKYPWLLKLGTIFADPSNLLDPITTPENLDRRYIGLRTQRIVTPRDVVETGTKEFKVLAKNKDLDPQTSLGIKANVFAEQNVIVGEDFEVLKDDVTPQPPTFPDATGNVKIASDLFLKGTLYASVGDKWLGLKQLIQNFVPEIQVLPGNEISTTAADVLATPPNNTIKVPLKSKVLVQPSAASLFVALSGIEWESMDALNTWKTDLDTAGNAAPIHAGITVGNVAKKPASANEFEASVSWSIGPISKPATAGNEKIHVKKLLLNYIVIFYP